MESSAIPSGGPDDALFRIARKLRLRYSHGFVVRAILAHSQPTSLLALVEVARRMGIETTPAKTDVGGLADVSLPAVVHFQGPGGAGGFGVLEGVSDAGFIVWDRVRGRRVIERDQFVAWWTGVVVLMRRSAEPGEPEHRYLRQRAFETIVGGSSTPALSGGPGSGALRIAFGIALVVLTGAAIARTAPPQRLAASLMVVLALGGVAVTTLMALSIRDGAFAARVCRRGKLVDCYGVLTSRFSRVFGIPWSDVGLAFYGGVTLLVASGGWLAPSSVWRICTLAFIATLPFAAALVAVQISMRQLCTLCMASHVVNLAGATVGTVALWRGPLRAVDAATAVAFAFYVGLVLFVVIPYFRRSSSLSLISDRYGRMAASPFGSLAQIATEPPTEVRGPSSAVPLDGSDGAHEVVLFVHPGCGKCLPVLRELVGVAATVPIQVFVGVAPKDPTASDRRACSVLVAAFMATRDHRVVEAYIAAKEHLARLSGPDGTRLLAAALELDERALEDRLEAAGRLVARAESAVDRHAEGTPALFFDSRPYTAPLEHLRYLLERHPELLGTA